MQTVVRTHQGAVRGSVADEVVAFKGIPYAAPPFGPNRFQPPQPGELWDGVREALNYGPTAPKARYDPPFDVLIPEVDIPGEDCLNLNIWSLDVGQASLPVMVWIHGGAFANGSGSVPTYDGTRFARGRGLAEGASLRCGGQPRWLLAICFSYSQRRSTSATGERPLACGQESGRLCLGADRENACPTASCRRTASRPTTSCPTGATGPSSRAHDSV
jgi:hypothetical protein